MKTKDAFGNLRGKVKITKRKVSRLGRFFETLGLWQLANKVSRTISVKRYNNLFLNKGRESVLNRMAGDDTGKLTYLAVGIDDAPADITDTKLIDEIFRKLLTTNDKDGLFVKTSTYLATTEANGDLKEVGLYGDNATGVKDSGTIFTRVIVDETKTNGESLTIDYDIEFLTS